MQSSDPILNILKSFKHVNEIAVFVGYLPGNELEQGKIPYVSSHASTGAAVLAAEWASTAGDTSSKLRPMLFGAGRPALQKFSGQ